MPTRLETWRSWWIVLGLLALTLALSELTSIDIRVQDWFFNEETGTWLIGRRDPIPRALFYNGPKYVIILLGVTLLTLLLGRPSWRERWHVTRKGLGVVLLTLAIVPALIGQIKATTGVYCPWDIRRYGGPAPYVRVFEMHPENDRPPYKGRGFPAGHASGGFALVGLAALTQTRRQYYAAIALALGLGWVMGIYQFAKGAHYVSHNLVTMWITWLVYVPIQRGMSRAGRESNLT
ncbi:phosphatase PAP2 family protein [Synoicihabitans lomoniglobus]|uniref:Phosphatase PAP2 family protein n=1 Tax=Synoicihabitans lomoniglobus TaxID=2909285 RepID=A0AAF0I1P1_9BACT|nr:phosphatase PAP2 family protein [Opitutaceae bacterium LMO-M01]WED65922.1 phosphatase PAP2 family protein [Opitutaceae bacterium LMO-M01]